MKVEKRAKTVYAPLPSSSIFVSFPRVNCHAITRFVTIATRAQTEVGEPVWVDSSKLVAAELTFISGHFVPFA